MPHLVKFRKGWENERLAAYLLSRFSFVTHPASSADDLGSDFFCTIFEIKNVNGVDALMPRVSFAIQVKSSMSRISMKGKTDYLMNLEMPFFLGVVKQSPPEMKLYSAEHLSLLFAEIGRPSNLSLKPVARLNGSEYYEKTPRGMITLLCPLVGTFSVNDDRPALTSKVEAIIRICLRAQNNIATRRSEEHIYDVDGSGTYKIVAGSGSAQYFRINFLKRLGEAFYNLFYIVNTGTTNSTLTSEFKAYESLYRKLRKIYPRSMPEFVTTPYRSLKVKMGK